MKHDFYNEQWQRGIFSFPVEYHYVTNHHPRFNMPYHWHIQYELIRVLKGTFVLSIDENEFVAKAGDVLFINEGCVHGGKAVSEDTVYECMVFDRKMFETNTGKQEMIQKFLAHNILLNNLFEAKQDYIHKIIWVMFNALKKRSIGYELIVQGGLFAFLGLAFEHKLYKKSLTNFANSNQRNVHKLKKAFKLIETSYDKPLTLEDLAKTADLSPKYFCKFFKAMTNKTPISYLNYYRIECVCVKLVNDLDTSVIDIAYECGFNDVSYFIKTFRKYKGTTPKKYINEYREEIAKQL